MHSNFQINFLILNQIKFMKKTTAKQLAAILALLTVILLPSCIPGGNPTPTPTPCYRYDVVQVWDSLHGGYHYDTVRIQIPCTSDTFPPIDSGYHHCDTILVDTTYLQPIYVWNCDSTNQNPDDSLDCRYVFSHNETIHETFTRLVNCR